MLVLVVCAEVVRKNLLAKSELTQTHTEFLNCVSGLCEMVHIPRVENTHVFRHPSSWSIFLSFDFIYVYEY